MSYKHFYAGHQGNNRLILATLMEFFLTCEITFVYIYPTVS